MRVPVLPLLVVLTLVPVGVLAWQLHRESAMHRASAQKMLDDCAVLGAEDYVRRVTIALDIGVLMPLNNVVSDLGPRDDVWALPEPKGEEARTQQILEHVAETFFRYRRGEPIRMSAVVDGVPGVDGVDGVDAAWLSTELDAYLRDRPRRGYNVALVTRPRGDDFVLLGCSVLGDDEVAGFVGSWDSFVDGFSGAMRMGTPVLSPLAGSDAESAVAILVRDPAERVLFESRPVPANAVVGRAQLERRHSELTVEAHLDPHVAGRILAGGVPRSRWLEILVLVLAVLVPLAAVLYLLRREQELARVRSGFVASVSHELRTPLAQIRMFAETLRLGRVRSDAEGRRSLEILDREARRLEDLVENVLQFSRAERQALSLCPRAQDLAPLVREVVEGFQPLAEARGARVELALSGSGAAVVDAAATRTILINLLDNALKYGPEGQTITVGLTSADDGVALFVDDEGPGVADADRARIWQRYWRAPGDAEAHTGAGIGLALVSELASRQAGEVFVGSAPGGGARIGVRFNAEAG